MPNGAHRLLVISYHFPPDGNVGGLRWAGITKYLARLGWDVAVLTAARPVGRDGVGGVQIEWCPRRRTLMDYYQLVRRGDPQAQTPVANAPHLVSRSRPPGLMRDLRQEVVGFLTLPDWSRGWILRAALRARSLVRRFRPQFVVSSGPPHSAHLVAGMATHGSSVRWYIDLRDPWADIPAGHPNPRYRTRTFRALAPRLERLAMRAASGVIANTPQLAETLAAKYPDVAVTCVRNGVDPEWLPPPARHPYPGLGIAYVGTLYERRDLGPVMEALRVFLQHHPEAAQAGSKLRVAGHADAPNALARDAAIASLGLEPYVDVLGLLPRAQALNVLSRSRLAVALADEEVPAKLYELVAMGIPTLVVARERSAAAVEAQRLGAAVRDPRDVGGIVRLLEQMWRKEIPQPSARRTTITYGETAALVQELLTGEDARALQLDRFGTSGG